MNTLRECLEFNGYSIDKFSTMVGVAPATVSKWVNNRFKPNKGKIKTIAKVLNLTEAETKKLFNMEG